MRFELQWFMLWVWSITGRPSTNEREGDRSVDSTKFDVISIQFGTGISRRKLLGRLAKVGAGAALAAVSVRARAAAAAGSCAYGPGTCQQGYVWREAYFGDKVCVTPDQRDQAAYDNAQAPYRVDPYGAYGPNTCISGYVWRVAHAADLVCVEPWVRDQVAFDNAQAAYRIQPGCEY
jgi:hypothetical protein